MSFVDHRCTCGHWGAHHRAMTGPRPGQCEICSCMALVLGDAELAHTYDVWGRPNTVIAAPGSQLGLAAPAHDCDDCRALYAKLTRGAA